MTALTETVGALSFDGFERTAREIELARRQALKAGLDRLWPPTTKSTAAAALDHVTISGWNAIAATIARGR